MYAKFGEKGEQPALPLLHAATHSCAMYKAKRADSLKRIAVMANLPSFEVPQQMRDLAENNITQARKAFDSFMEAAKRGAETMRGSAELSRTSMQDMSARRFDYA